jgi:hypothetical protein
MKTGVAPGSMAFSRSGRIVMPKLLIAERDLSGTMGIISI